MVARQAGIDPDEIEEVFTHHENVSYIAISQQTAPEIVQQWQASLDEMKADGTFWWLTRRWLPAETVMVAETRGGSLAPLALKLYTENSPPSSFLKGGRLRGLSVEVVQEILRRIGQPDTISLVPWARGYKLALSEADTALFSATRLIQRESLFEWVGPLYQQHWGFYGWKGAHVDIPTMAAAREVGRIGTYHQDAKMQYLQAQGFDNLVPTNKNITNLMHLKHGSIDLWVSSDFNMPHLARQAGLSPDQLELAYTFTKVGNYIAFSKKTSAHVIRLWQAVLNEIKSDGTYERICRKYEYRPH
jgi:polar amino acid transport system substrate-binding protein